jgi:hypothetical protein
MLKQGSFVLLFIFIDHIRFLKQTTYEKNLHAYYCDYLH